MFAYQKTEKPIGLVTHHRLFEKKCSSTRDDCHCPALHWTLQIEKGNVHFLGLDPSFKYTIVVVSTISSPRTLEPRVYYRGVLKQFELPSPTPTSLPFQVHFLVVSTGDSAVFKGNIGQCLYVQAYTMVHCGGMCTVRSIPRPI